MRHKSLLIIAISVAVLAGNNLNATPNNADGEKPNVIFIFVDDQGYYDLGCYGAREVKTPRIDALAEKGLRFTDYYAAAPICSPSRTGLMTGCYPRRTGNAIWVHRPDSKDGIPPSLTTMAELFQNEGYATACIGKWHLGFEEPFLPHNQGFDHYFGILHNLDSYEVFHFEEEGGMPLLRNGEVVIRNPDPGTLTRLYTEEAISWIGKRHAQGESFFLYLPHTMLHIPLGVSEAFEGSSDWGIYGDAIQEMDFYVGHLMDALERIGIADRTILVYASDNGRGPGRNEEQAIRGGEDHQLRRRSAGSLHSLCARSHSARSYLKCSGPCHGLVPNTGFSGRY